MRVHSMDMGERRSCDCTVVPIDRRSILIDGGHRGDERAVEDGGTALLGAIRAALVVEGRPFAVVGK